MIKLLFLTLALLISNLSMALPAHSNQLQSNDLETQTIKTKSINNLNTSHEPNNNFTKSGRFSMQEFRLNSIGAYQLSGSTYSMQINWSPYYGLDEKIGLRGNIGLSFFKQQITGIFFLIDSSILFSYQISQQIIVEAGPGLQRWFTNPSNTGLMLSFNVRYQFSNKLLRWIDSLIIGYSPVFMSDGIANEVKLGAQITF